MTGASLVNLAKRALVALTVAEVGGDNLETDTALPRKFLPISGKATNPFHPIESSKGWIPGGPGLSFRELTSFQGHAESANC